VPLTLLLLLFVNIVSAGVDGGCIRRTIPEHADVERFGYIPELEVGITVDNISCKGYFLAVLVNL
jgi:hypothetical protein